ncbi:FliH/SctL family protein [Pseudokineococcus sp. 1T1Z-3]|uniref:FliH/SctL family protein n=1 Tax=Pseudokineococcus sp. 1T1Z-3 TaxID=3132745 RepID=UPI003097B3EB
MSTSPDRAGTMTFPLPRQDGPPRPAPWLVGADSVRGAGSSGGEGRGDGRAAGYAAGYASGWAAGAAAAAQRAQAALDAELERRLAERAREREQARSALLALLRATADLDARHVPVIGECTDALARTGIELATAVVGAEVRGGAGARAALLRALAPCPPAGAVVVRLHPGDLVEVRAAGEVPDRVELVADPSLERGDAIAEHPGGSVDARLRAAVDRAREVLLGAGS